MGAAALPRYFVLQIAILLDALRSRTSGWLAKAAAALALLGVLAPFGRIAMPAVQHPHADHLAALLIGFVVARGLVPSDVRGSSVRRRMRAWRRAGHPTAWQHVQFGSASCAPISPTPFAPAPARRRAADHRQELGHALAEIHAELRNRRT